MRKSGLPMLAAALLSGFVTAAAAEPARDSVFLPLQPAPSTNSLDPVRTTSRSGSVAGATSMPLAGNPLWAIALGDLSETKARPLFSPLRRPPAAPVLAAVAATPVKLAPPAKSGPDHPLLTLLGTMVGDVVEIGVFTDEVSHDVVRLKAGEAHDGWILSAISGRAAIFQKQGYPAATLVLPAPDANAASLANTFATPVIPAATKGGVKRPPREG
jgi:general secretion pathway protein N